MPQLMDIAPPPSRMVVVAPHDSFGAYRLATKVRHEGEAGRLFWFGRRDMRLDCWYHRIRGRIARRALRWLALAAAVIGCFSQALAGDGRPNIVVIMSDDAGYNEFGFSSAVTGQGTQFETPNLDALAQQSVVARQGYVVHPLCSPSRAGILTGQYPQRYGFEGNLNTSLVASVPDTTGLTAANTTMAQHLKGLGYTTGMVGKWHLGYQDVFQ
jgi:Sulfatase